MSTTAHGHTPYYYVPAESRHPVMAAIGLFFGGGAIMVAGPFAGFPGGPLAAILMVASGMGDIWRGGLLLLVYGLNTWLPKLMHDAGYSLATSLSLLLMLNIARRSTSKAIDFKGGE